ncbi:MAG: LLM class flavin-dependent oxidoreductase [Acidimicrobiales bacterium]
MNDASLRRGVFLPPFNELADPHRLVDLAVAAEERGWDGFFLWDHVLRRPEQAMDVADPWVALAAIAVATSRIRIGTMVTPIVRRRPQVLARQVVTLDHLSNGRAVLGLGLGVDTSGELSRFGEVLDPVERGDILDEGAKLLAHLLAGERVEHRGRYFMADGVQLLPRSVQRPRVPMWFGVRGSGSGLALSGRALRRAAKYDGLFLIDPILSDLDRVLASVGSERVDGLRGFEVAVLGVPAIPASLAAARGASWWMTRIRPEVSAAEVEALVLGGPPD